MRSNQASAVTGTIKVRWTFKPRHNGRKRKDGPGIGPRDIEPGNVPWITRLMALAIKFDGIISRGEVRDYADLARLGYVTRARITQIMNLLNLAPDIQEEILFLPRTVKRCDLFLKKEKREPHHRPFSLGPPVQYMDGRCFLEVEYNYLPRKEASGRRADQ